jgi:hypothetical protein
LAAKEAWAAWWNLNQIRNARAFYPFLAKDKVPPALDHETGHFHGVYKDTGQFYTVYFYKRGVPVLGGFDINIMRCAGIKEWPSLANPRYGNDVR